MSLFINFWEVLTTAIVTFAKAEGADIKEEILKDIKEILEKAKDDIKRWVPLYVKGKITQDELMWLIKGQKNIAELLLLEQKGLKRVQINNIINKLSEIIRNTIIMLFTPVG